ncbi:50S ribosome-binding GTPase [Patescibacteria group bacterium]|nr:50S ribosome-binding GTPase [Patescibacteria group bacterium]
MIVGLVGRTNVGKSTLFNRLLGTFRAIVTDIPGTTRELLREEKIINGRDVTLVDSP